MSFHDCISSHPSILMEGALGERLKREYHLKIDGPVAMACLIYDEKGRAALKSLWEEYIRIARKYDLPFIATTPTRRANRERVLQAGYNESIIKDNVDFLREIQKSADTEMYIGGLLGCKGDAYTSEGALNKEQAIEFHSWQIDLFKTAGVDFLFAGIMPTLPEATGMAIAMAEANLPYIISFTIQKDGKLMDGHTIDYAIRSIDESVLNKPVCYMTNCVHPTIVNEALSHSFNRTEVVQKRFMGIQANTSALPYCELDGASDLKTSSPIVLADGMRTLKEKYHLKIFGGCCGTDHRHLEEIAKRIK